MINDTKNNMKTFSRIAQRTLRIIVFAYSVLMFSCSQQPVDVQNTDALPPIFPDYVGVTIPADIAPLNFNVDGAEYVCVVAKGSLGGELTVSGEWADFDIDGWHSLTRQNVGGTIAVSVTAKTDGGKWIGYRDFEINVSGDPLDEYGLTYRKIAPGYETFSNIAFSSPGKLRKIIPLYCSRRCSTICSISATCSSRKARCSVVSSKGTYST